MNVAHQWAFFIVNSTTKTVHRHPAEGGEQQLPHLRQIPTRL
jgi:hypothetical protein